MLVGVFAKDPINLPRLIYSTSYEYHLKKISELNTFKKLEFHGIYITG